LKLTVNQFRKISSEKKLNRYQQFYLFSKHRLCGYMLKGSACVIANRWKIDMIAFTGRGTDKLLPATF